MQWKERLQSFVGIVIVCVLFFGVWPPGLAILITGLCGEEFYSAVLLVPCVRYSVMSAGIAIGALFSHAAMTAMVALFALGLVASEMLQTAAGPSRPGPERLHLLALRILGLIYPHYLFHHALLMYVGFDAGPISVILFVILTTAGGENGALLAGLVRGGEHPVPNLSPNKTTAGFIAQVVTSVLIACASGNLLAGHATSPASDMPFLGLLGLLIGIFGILGDLFESYVKRCFDLKDIGRLLPGVGGLLDRMDGLIFTFPLTYTALRCADRL